MVSQIYPSDLQLNKTNTSHTETTFYDLHLSISNNIVSTKIYDKRDDFDFQIVIIPFIDDDVPLSTSPESIPLNSFFLLEHLAMLLTSTLAINCLLRNFINKAIGITNFANHFYILQMVL